MPTPKAYGHIKDPEREKEEKGYADAKAKREAAQAKRGPPKQLAPLPALKPPSGGIDMMKSASGRKLAGAHIAKEKADKEQQSVETGARGGRFYLSKNGQKVYVK